MPMLRSNLFGKSQTAAIILTALLLFLSVNAWSAVSVETREIEKLQVVSGKSIVLKSTRPIKRVSIANPEIADFVLLSSREIYITGKSAGSTNLTLWQNKTIVAIYDVEVAYDISRLKQVLHDALPDEKDIRVVATHDSITLSGRVSSAANSSQAMTVAEAYAPEGKVNNLLEVGGVHQVMLEVRFAEMSRQLINRLGVNFSYIRGGDFGISSLGGLIGLDEIGGDISFSSSVNALFRFHKGSASWTGFIDALKSDGLIKVLAEPTLITLSGQPANFLAGGEFPVPVPQGLGTVGIEYKPFGVGLSFTPTVLDENKINIKVTPEVSELDFSVAQAVEGFFVPGLSTRKASTTVELADGQSFAIAGLIKETVRDNLDKFPFLGDIPILGILFRSREFQKNETELIIIATPRLVKPLDLAKQPLPTDYYIEPDDTEFFLMGLMEGREKNSLASKSAELDGDFGHAMP